MKIIEPSFSLETPFGPLTPEMGIQMLRFIEAKARISHRSEDAQTENSWKRMLKAVLIDRGDWSIAEHASVTGLIRTDRGITHELVRHRLFSYTQESTRFVNYNKGKAELQFIKPLIYSEAPNAHESSWYLAMQNSENSYQMLLSDGLRPQEARSVLPNSLAATIAVTGNLRNWRKFLLARTSRETHPDFRRWSVPMLEQFKQMIPIIFDDINPNDRQIDNFRKAA